MNDLTLLPQNELDVLVRDIDRRAVALTTPQGQKKAADMMLEVLHLIEAAGYVPKTDLADMAMVWTMAMIDQIAIYQFKGIREAVMEFIRTDSREYTQFPSAGQIIELCKQMGVNPRAELGRRRQAEFERMVDEERRREMDALPEEYKKACVERLKSLWSKNENRMW